MRTIFSMRRHSSPSLRKFIGSVPFKIAYFLLTLLITHSTWIQLTVFPRLLKQTVGHCLVWMLEGGALLDASKQSQKYQVLNLQGQYHQVRDLREFHSAPSDTCHWLSLPKHKRYTLWSYTNREFGGIVVFTIWPCCRSSEEARRMIYKHFKTVDYISCFFTKRNSKTVRHCSP